MGIPPLEEVRIGQSVSVTCLAERPSVSTLGNPRNLAEFWLGPLVGAPLVLGLFAAFGVALSLKGVSCAQLNFISNQTMELSATRPHCR